MTPLKKLMIPMVIIIVSLMVVAAQAQMLQEGDLLIHPEELMKSGISGNGHGAYIRQVGNANEIILIQDQIGAEGNLARVLQTGNTNLAEITQAGGINQLVLMQQGEANEFDLVSNGQANRTVAVQQGTENTIVQRLIQSSHIQSELIQIGHNNLIITELRGIHSRALQIRQEGNGMRAIVREIGN